MHTKDFENFFSLRISQLRHQKNVSAREMSLAIGQSENYISRIESKRMLPSMLVLFYICEYFGIQPKEFFDTDMENPSVSKELLEKFQKLTPAQSQHILAIMDDILER